ncbi:MAG: hypothetical protein LBM65_01900 [Oscillospiraceae bacterium]|jgi:hypothetical protein|nr:hypothetical protein [Oscillospiraceae bacterium]
MTTQTKQKKSLLNKLPLIGFLIMLSGAAIIIIEIILFNIIGTINSDVGNVITWVTIVLPGIGAVLCIISLFRWKKIGLTGQVLSVLTVVMCNPWFYYIYFIICIISGYTLAGLQWM